MTPSLTLWDSTDSPPKGDGLVYTWNGFVEKDSVCSLRRYVESNGEELRQKYFRFIHDLGEAEVNGKQLKANLDIGDGFSLWWMSLLAEKSIWKSPSIDTVIRAFALEELVLKLKPEKFTLVSANQPLNKVLRSFCLKRGITYKWKRLSSLSSKTWCIKSIYSALPHPLQALTFLARHIWSRWPLRKAGNYSWFEGRTALFFCSYFTQIVSRLAGEGKYYSRFWGDLCGLMANMGFSGNWLQHYCPDNALPTPQLALDWAQRFNKEQEEQGFHAFLDTYLSWGTVLKVLKSWLRLMSFPWNRNDIRRAFCPQGSELCLWPVMKEDWYASVLGSVAISNLLWVELFDKALRKIPYQRKGFYLCENIAWERALIQSWRKHGHGELIAVVHGVIRFWDMRYFHDSRTIRSLSSFSMPQANVTVLNGKLAVEVYSSMGYSDKAIAEGEALRNNYLYDLKANYLPRKARGDEIRVLILGEGLPLGTIEMLQLLEAAVPHLSGRVSFTMKPHPAYQVKSLDYPSLNLKVTMDPLEEILDNYDVAYSTNLTSAVIDAYLVGLTAVVRLNEEGLNYCPLRGQPDVCFVSTPEELAKALHIKDQNERDRPDSNDFFFLDPELPRWRKLLEPVQKN
jgi:surface carbohydrate biosynthesis protein (TIGR04326 family)